MAIGVVKNESTIALVAEVTEGTYVAPSTGADYVQPLADGLELNKQRELLERDILSSTVENEAARVGVAEVQGAIPVELRANETAGSAPQGLDILLRSALGGKRQQTAAVTTGTTHSSTVINMADTTDFNVGDMVLVKESGAYEIRPISVVTSNTSITLKFALDNGAPSDGVELEKFTTYYSDTANAISFSAEHNIGSQAIKQKVEGLRVTTASIENWTVGQIPTVNCSVQGLDLTRVDEDATATPTDADALPPVVLSACVWINGTQYSYTELGLSIENTVNYIQDACDADGRISSRITNQVVNLTMNPYMDDSSLTNWNAFENNDDVHIFGYAYNPSSTAGEFSEAVAFYIPQAKIVESPVGDNDGIVSDQLSVRAHRENGNDSIFLGFV